MIPDRSPERSPRSNKSILSGSRRLLYVSWGEVRRLMVQEITKGGISMGLKATGLGFLFLGLALAWFNLGNEARAQTKEEKISLTKAQIMEGAKKEGKLSVSPGFDDLSIPKIVKAFENKYPFIKVTWTFAEGIPALQRQLFDMSAGRTDLDVYNSNIAFWSEYFKQNVIKKVDLKGMAQAGHLNIPQPMIDDSGMVVWLGTNTGVLVYNSKQVPPDKAPKGWDSCLDPYYKSKFSVDTKPNVLAWLTPAWGEEKLLGFARRLKENSPV